MYIYAVKNRNCVRFCHTTPRNTLPGTAPESYFKCKTRVHKITKYASDENLDSDSILQYSSKLIFLFCINHSNPPTNNYNFITQPYIPNSPENITDNLTLTNANAYI